MKGLMFRQDISDGDEVFFLFVFGGIFVRVERLASFGV